MRNEKQYLISGDSYTHYRDVSHRCGDRDINEMSENGMNVSVFLLEMLRPQGQEKNKNTPSRSQKVKKGKQNPNK